MLLSNMTNYSTILVAIVKKQKEMLVFKRALDFFASHVSLGSCYTS